MENKSMFWNRIEDWIDGLGLSGWEAMIIVLAAFFLVLILWIVFRRARLWYWKTDMHLDTLKSIDSHLKNVEEKLSHNAEIPVGTENLKGMPEKSEAAPDRETAGDDCGEQAKDGLTAVGKSGKVYTEAELELQIRE